jgi:transposase
VKTLYSHVAAIDAGKTEIAVALPIPGTGPGSWHQELRTYKTFYGVLRELCRWLAANDVTHVALEATGIYSKPLIHALAQFSDVEIVLCNAAHVKNVPGRKTDAADAAWLAELLEVGLLRGVSCPPNRSPHCGI